MVGPFARSRNARLAAVTTAVLLAVSGCTVSNADKSPWSEQMPAGGGQQTSQSPPPLTPPGEPPVTTKCPDPDPMVIGTCLDGTGSVLLMPDGSGVVAERAAGRIVTVKRNQDPNVVASIPVDASGDGGLMSFAYSPTYEEDRMIFAYITTPSDNRVVRIVPGDAPKPVLTGIPKGPNGNMGDIWFTPQGDLMIATGNAGNPGSANDRSSLAGKLLLLNDTDKPGPPKVIVSGLGQNPAICTDILNPSDVFITDRAASEDRLQMVSNNTARVVWSWPNRPGLAGCAVSGNTILVSETETMQVETLTKPTAAKPGSSAPVPISLKKYGKIGRLSPSLGGFYAFTTVNKHYGKPTKTDDRVVIQKFPSGSAAEPSD